MSYPAACARLEPLLIASFRHVVGHDLVAVAGGPLYDAPAVVLMHGTEADPVFCYANRTAQARWGYTWDAFTQLPSRLSAEADARPAREALLARARTQGFVDDYQGIRIACDGRRFRIQGVTLWNVVVEGHRYGQAVVFRSWQDL